MVKTLEVVQIPAGEMGNFAYIVYCPSTKNAVGIDPSFAPDLMLQEVEQRDLTLIALLNTHGHHDHIAGNQTILDAVSVPLAAHPADLPDADICLRDGSVIDLGQGQIDVLHTPGHTPGSVVFSTG
ncbi:MAG: hypothetical protein C0618_06005, partial [Desulfuromonas sp.]